MSSVLFGCDERTSEPTLNAVEALACAGGDYALLIELVEIFRAESPKILAEIQRCVLAGDSSGLERAAHRLRGSVCVFGAHAAADAAQALEIMGRDGIATEAVSTLADLERQLDRVVCHLLRLREHPVLGEV